MKSSRQEIRRLRKIQRTTSRLVPRYRDWLDNLEDRFGGLYSNSGSDAGQVLVDDLIDALYDGDGNVEFSVQYAQYGNTDEFLRGLLK
jgi:hypothetical protein